MKYLLVFLVMFLNACATTCQGVIGAPFDPVSYLVDYALAGSPAEKAGIKTGDELIEPWKIPGEVGTKVTVQYIRNNKTYSVEMTRACVDTFDTKPKVWR